MATSDLSTRCDFYIYCLFRENGIPFYIGKGQRRRWMQHIYRARSNEYGHRYNIIRNMLARNVEMPIIKIHDGLNEITAHEYEIALIAAIGREPNGPLVNLTDGGDGASGWKATDETRAKMSASRLGKKHTQEAIARMSAARIGEKKSPEAIAKTAAWHRGRTQSAEHKAKNSAANRGRKLSAEHIAKTAAGLRGKKKSPERVAKMAATMRVVMRGKKKSPEHVAKILASRLANARSALSKDQYDMSLMPNSDQS